MQRHCFTTRVWPNPDIPLHRGGIDIWSNLVFIHYWVLPKKLSILSIDTWGKNPFFHPLLIQAKFASGTFGAHGPALSSQFPGRGGGRGGGSRRKGSGAGEPPVLLVNLMVRLSSTVMVLWDAFGRHSPQLQSVSEV